MTISIPAANTKRPLMPHQIDYIRWVSENAVDHPGCFMEMRLGKTLANIRLVYKWYPTTKLGEPVNVPIIVVAPVTVLEAWEKELRLEKEFFFVLHGKKRKSKEVGIDLAFQMPCRMWVLVNYETLNQMPEIAEKEWQVAILDESTKIKNPDTAITKICVNGFRDVKHRIVLSGLPSPEGPLNLFNQYKFLNNKFCGFDNFYRFRTQNFEMGSDQRYSPKPGISQMVRNAAHEKGFFLRREDAGLKGHKIKETRSVEMEPEQLDAYKFAEDLFMAQLAELDEDGKKKTVDTMHKIVAMTWCARIAGGSDIAGVHQWHNKTGELVDLLKGDLSGQPVVVWFRFNSEIESVAKILREKNIACKTLYAGSKDEPTDDGETHIETKGKTGREYRKEILEWFRNSPTQGRVLLAQISLAKFGIDVSVADTAIYYSMNYSCEAITQSEDRIYHPLKKSPLLYIYLVAQDTIDEQVIYAINSKATDAKAMMAKMIEGLYKRLQLEEISVKGELKCG